MFLELHTSFRHFADTNVHFMSHKPDDAKNDESSKERRQTVTDGYHQRVSKNEKKNQTQNYSLTLMVCVLRLSTFIGDILSCLGNLKADPA